MLIKISVMTKLVMVAIVLKKKKGATKLKNMMN
jgi:hypothetical protein